MRKHPRREIEEQQLDDTLLADPEQVELDSFLDAIGAEGSVRVKLYRLTPTGKQVFLQEGPPSIFSESGVQAEHGGGDYLLRSLLNGRWHRSKAFSVASSPGALITTVQSQTNGADAELERLKVQLETQRIQLERQQVQMEADRKEREQRNHELMLKILETTRRDSDERYVGPTLPELIASVKDLRTLGGAGDAVSNLTGVVNLLREASSLVGNGDGSSDWKSVLATSLAPMIPGVVSSLKPKTTMQPTASVESPVTPVEPRPLPEPATTAYDQISAQMRSLFERVQAQASNGLDGGFVLDNLIALEEQGDPVAALVLNSFEKSATFESWLVWLRSMIGTEAVLNQPMSTFLASLYTAAKALPKEEEVLNEE